MPLNPPARPIEFLQKHYNTAPVWSERVVQRTVTQQEAEGERPSQTGSFMREEARDSQPTPASLLLTEIRVLQI